MSHLFGGLTPDQVLSWPMARWVRYKAWTDDYQSKQAKKPSVTD